MEKSGSKPIDMSFPDEPPPSYDSVTNPSSHMQYSLMQAASTHRNDSEVNQMRGLRIYENPISARYTANANDDNSDSTNYLHSVSLNENTRLEQPITVYAPPTQKSSCQSACNRCCIVVSVFFVTFLLLRQVTLLIRKAAHY